MRLAPAVGAAFLTLAVALPAFLMHEPDHESEPAGPLLVALAVLAFAAAGHCIVRGWRVWAATRALLRRCGRATGSHAGAGTTVDIVDLPEPFAAVVGAWRPRILAAACLRAACSDEEFRLVIAHEAAHGSAHDNRKLLLQILSPDALAWMPAGAALTERWRAAAELDADARASGGDPRKRLALASALLKVGALVDGNDAGALARAESARGSRRRGGTRACAARAHAGCCADSTDPKENGGRVASRSSWFPCRCTAWCRPPSNCWFASDVDLGAGRQKLYERLTPTERGFW